jgi:nucleoside-diphosphate-sugar epimerase
MRILLTGATGFIGSYLARYLSQRHEVAAILQPEAKKERLKSILPANAQLNWNGRAKNLPGLIEKFHPEVVIHLAGHIAYSHGLEDIDRLIDGNIRFGALVLDAVSAAGCQQFIHTGSVWQHDGNEAYSPLNLYAATKQAFADMLTHYVKNQGVRAITLELADTYGPDDKRPKMLSALQKAAIEDGIMPMSPGDQFIDMVHVRDVAAAYEQAIVLLSGLSDHQQRTYAVRSGQPLRLKEFVALYNEVAPRPVQVEWGARPYRARETMQPWTQGEVLPGWQPKIGLREGLRELLAAS